MRIAPYRAIYPNADLISSNDSFIKNVKYEYSKYFKNGFFKKTSQEAFYIYEIDQLGKKHLGILATIDIEDYINGNIKVHENTLAAKEQKTTDLIMERKSMIKPILLSYPRSEGVEALIMKYKNQTEPFYSIELEKGNIRHTLYRMTDGVMVEQIQNLFDEIPCLYIADGHHRTSTTANLYQLKRGKKRGLDFRWLHVALFPFEQLQIHDYNRVVEILDEMSPTILVARLSHFFRIQPLKKPAMPEKKHQLTLIIDEEVYRLEWKDEILALYQEESIVLDAAIFNDVVLREIMGIEDVRDDARVSYVEGPKGIEGMLKKVQKKDSRVGFCLPPVSTEEFIAVSDAGKTLPPKSTWFEPRLKNGLIVQDLRTSVE